MVAQEAGIEEILHEFADFAGDAVLIGHNVALDLALINRTRRLENPTLVQMLRSMGAFPWRRCHMLEDLSALYDEPVRDRIQRSATRTYRPGYASACRLNSTAWA